MNLNKLLLNPSNTEFLLTGTKQQRLKFSDLTNLSLSNDIISVRSSARNIDYMDWILLMFSGFSPALHRLRVIHVVLHVFFGRHTVSS